MENLGDFSFIYVRAWFLKACEDNDLPGAMIGIPCPCLLGEASSVITPVATPRCRRGLVPVAQAFTAMGGRRRNRLDYLAHVQQAGDGSFPRISWLPASLTGAASRWTKSPCPSFWHGSWAATDLYHGMVKGGRLHRDPRTGHSPGAVGRRTEAIHPPPSLLR